MTRASEEGTRRYAKAHLAAEGHFRRAGALRLSSFGLGTYLGEADEATDRLYVEAAKACLLGGVNVLDTAINYRHQRSERCLGEALGELVSGGGISRDEVVVCTKGGYIPFDGSMPQNPERYLEERFAGRGILDLGRDLVGGCHAMTPAYLRDQIATSLENLRLSCIDIYYLHNPETQLAELSPEAFYGRLRSVFEALEEEADEGRLLFYGTATWNGYRMPPGSPQHLSLEHVAATAREVGGDGHRFRFVQVPLNLAMLEGVASVNQVVDGVPLPLVGAAAELGIHVIASASLLQGRLSRNLPPALEERVAGLRSDAQRSLQVVRSLPGLTTALVGMSNPAHVAENLELASVPPLSESELEHLFAHPG